MAAASMAGRAAGTAREDVEEAPDSRERILASALSAFSELGFEGATTREIAQRAGVNLGLIQYYFEGKENLWRASVERAFTQLRALLDEILAETGEHDERERTRRLIAAFVRFVAEKPEFVRIMHDEGKRDGPRMRWLVDHHVREFYGRVRDLLERARPSGSIPDGPELVSLHYVLVGAMVLMFHQAEECKYLTGVDPSDPSVVETHARTLERLLLGSPREESAS